MDRLVRIIYIKTSMYLSSAGPAQPDSETRG